MANNQLTDKRARLRKAAQDYQSSLSWYQENLDSPNAEQDCDESTAAFKREIGHRETDIIADLLDEIDELRECLKARIVPDGWIAVPVEPTGDMLARIKLSKVWTTEALTARYKDMLRAAPRAPQRLANESLNQLIAIESLANDNAHEERRIVDQIYHADIVAALEELRERREASVKAGSVINNKMFAPAKGPKIPPMANKAFTVAVDLAISEFIPIEMTGKIALTQHGIKPANYKQWVKGWNACRAAIKKGGKA